LAMIASRRRWGTTSRNRSSRLPISSDCWIEIPVTLPPGRAKLATKPALTESDATAKTIGMVVVACFTTAAAPPYVTITSTCRRRNSAVKSLTRAELPPAQRYSTSIVSPVVQPSSRRRVTKEAVHELQTVASAPSTPTSGGVPCCARATSGHAATVPGRSLTNSRRVMGRKYHIFRLRTVPYVTPKRGAAMSFGSFASGSGRPPLQPCPLCPESDGRPPKCDRSRWANNDTLRCSKQLITRSPLPIRSLRRRWREASAGW
jgi:hypothetical protein